MSPEPPLDATGIARRHFSPARKGYDPAEVRGFLHELSDLVARLQRAEAHQLERAERAEARAELAEQLDQHRLVELLGEETARVLDAARQASTDIRAKAEESAARMIGDAQEEAHKIVEQAEHDGALRRIEILAEADAIRRDAESALERARAEGQVLIDEMRRQAESERERMLAEGEQARADAEGEADRVRVAARDEARELVGEAESVRERLLGDLARRRRSAREQLERLNAARERLLAAYEVVRRTVDEATTELTVALPEAKAASELALRRVTDEPDPTVEELEAELAVARMAGLVDDDATERDERDVARLDALIDGGLELDDLHLGDLSEGRAGSSADAGRSSGGDAGGRGTATGTGPGERWRRFRRRLSEGQGGDAPVAGDPSTSISEPVRPATGASTDVLGLDPADAAEAEADTSSEDPDEVDVLADAFDANESDALDLDTDDSDGAAAVDSDAAGTAKSDEEAGSDDAPGSDASQGDDDHADVAQLFARLKAGRSDTDGPLPDAPGAGGEAGESAGGGVAVAIAHAAGGAGSHLAVVPPLASADDASVEALSEADDTLDSEADSYTEAPDPDAEVLTARDASLEPVERDLGRRLKRVLADEQNEVFDLLRRDKPASIDDVVPGPAEHAHRYASAALADLETAATHGAASVDGEVAAASCAALADELGQSLVEPMRERIVRSFDECDGDLEEVTERLRSLYREWKGQRIGEAVRHYGAAAYAWGVYEAAPAGTRLRWLVDRTGESCPDADDNALAGDVSKGEAFPTGVQCSPAHPGCRCLVVPVGSAGSDG